MLDQDAADIILLDDNFSSARSLRESVSSGMRKWPNMYDRSRFDTSQVPRPLMAWNKAGLLAPWQPGAGCGPAFLLSLELLKSLELLGIRDPANSNFQGDNNKGDRFKSRT